MCRLTRFPTWDIFKFYQQLRQLADEATVAQP